MALFCRCLNVWCGNNFTWPFCMRIICWCLSVTLMGVLNLNISISIAKYQVLVELCIINWLNECWSYNLYGFWHSHKNFYFSQNTAIKLQMWTYVLNPLWFWNSMWCGVQLRIVKIMSSELHKRAFMIMLLQFFSWTSFFTYLSGLALQCILQGCTAYNLFYLIKLNLQR
jgi:hypothetical protein